MCGIQKYGGMLLGVWDDIGYSVGIQINENTFYVLLLVWVLCCVRTV